MAKNESPSIEIRKTAVWILLLLLVFTFSRIDYVLAWVELPASQTLVEGKEAVFAVPSTPESPNLGEAPIAQPVPEPYWYEVEVQESHISEFITYNPAIYRMIDQVTTGALYDLMERLTGVKPTLVGGSPYTIMTRHTNSGIPIQKATQYVYEYLGERGLDREYHYWNYSSLNNRNVVGEMQGVGQPEKIVLITAHLDNMPPGSVAPGADDNASGVAGVMMAAEILSKYRWDYTVRFVTFTGEEQGLIGSRIYATRSINQGEQIQGVLNLDMISYNTDDYPIVDLHARSWLPGSVAIANLFANVVTTYGINLTPDIKIDQSLGNYSDNKSFWDTGYSAILAIEDYDDFTPYYHTVNDTLSTLDMGYFTNFVKASVGTFANMGALLPTGWMEGLVTDMWTGEPISGATVEASLAAGSPVSALTDENGYYHLLLEPGFYNVDVMSDGYALYNKEGLDVPNFETVVLNASLLGPPAAGFYLNKSLPNVGEEVFFTNTTLGSDPISFEWIFGDGETSTDMNPSHIFTKAGSFTVILTATNDYGSDEASATLYVVEPPTAGFTFIPIVILAGQEVHFTNTTMGTEPVNFEWEFDNGNLKWEALILKWTHGRKVWTEFLDR
jgi:PKD repeat protein